MQKLSRTLLGHDPQGGVRFGGRLGADAESYVPWGVLAAGLLPMILATLDRRLAHFAFLEKKSPEVGYFLSSAKVLLSHLALQRPVLVIDGGVVGRCCGSGSYRPSPAAGVAGAPRAAGTRSRRLPHGPGRTGVTAEA